MVGIESLVAAAAKPTADLAIKHLLKFEGELTRSLGRIESKLDALRQEDYESGLELLREASRQPSEADRRETLKLAKLKFIDAVSALKGDPLGRSLAQLHLATLRAVLDDSMGSCEAACLAHANAVMAYEEATLRQQQASELPLGRLRVRPLTDRIGNAVLTPDRARLSNATLGGFFVAGLTAAPPVAMAAGGAAAAGLGVQAAGRWLGTRKSKGFAEEISNASAWRTSTRHFAAAMCARFPEAASAGLESAAARFESNSAYSVASELRTLLDQPTEEPTEGRAKYRLVNGLHLPDPLPVMRPHPLSYSQRIENLVSELPTETVERRGSRQR